jgi:predicted AlkP superfamily pyrophosphatase or phosphodiesterase
VINILKPDYNGGSIVNLMSSIIKGLGGKPTYKELKYLSGKEISKYKNVVLIVIDGLGYNYLIRRGDDSILKENLKGRITSVFPPTTASCITTFATGVAPQQHGITGWFMYLKELGMITAILRTEPRIKGCHFSDMDIDLNKIFTEKDLTNKIKVKVYTVIDKEILNSEYNRTNNTHSKMIEYQSIEGCFKGIKKAISMSGRKYVYAYWPDLDSIAHKKGMNSKAAYKHFKDIDMQVKKLAEYLEGKNTLLMITADHGLIDTPKEKTILIKDHPKLAECLTLQLSGEPRCAYCYVRPGRLRQFKRYVNTHLKKEFYLIKSENLVKKGFYGLYKPHPRLYDRIGDYALAAKENYAIRDALLDHKEKIHIGNHGGISAEEMYVPLIVIRSD